MNRKQSKFQSFIVNIGGLLIVAIFFFGWFGFGIYFLFSEYSETVNAKESINWWTTDGIIISSDIKEKKDEGGGKRYSPKILYSYSVQRIKYSSTKISFGEYAPSLENARKIVNQYPAGKIVTVYYNPDKHNLSVLVPGGKTISYWRLFAGVLVILIGIFALLQILIFDRRKEREIADTLRQASLRLGMKYFKKDESLKNEDFGLVPLFQKGEAVEFRNVVRGQKDGVKVMLFQYCYLYTEGGETEAHDQLVAVIGIPERRLPGFRMYPKKLSHKIGLSYGKYDINFQSYREFSNNYVLQGMPELAVRRLFDSEILQFFSKERGWFIEGGGDWLVIYKATPINLDAVLSLEKDATLISRLFPNRILH
jgi:hypothetical protein